MQSVIHQTVDHLFRRESGKLVSVLSKLLGLQNLETAQDIVQDTLLHALTAWTYHGLPDNPPAWLHKVARNKAVDYLRRGKNFRVNISPNYAYLLRSEYILAPTVNCLFEEDQIQDSQLRMIFACSHPAIPPESQVALSLKTLCGLSATEIARAFLCTEDTIAKRIYRAKEKIRKENIELELPDADHLPERLESVLKSIYLLFSEGYNSSHPDHLIRRNLCEDAMRLVYLLTQYDLTNTPTTQALLSLFCFQTSRLQARLDDKGHIILLKYQDRTKWYRPLIRKGFYYLDRAIKLPFETSSYHLEAAIASLHASACSFEETDWKAIAFLYDQLYRVQPTPVVAMNKAIATGYANEKQLALEMLQEIKELDNYYLYHTSLGEVYFEMDRKEEAINAYEKALSLTVSKPERQLIMQKIQNCLETL